MLPFGRPLGASDDFVCDKDDTVTEGPGVDEAHGFLGACLAEQVLASPEHDGEDLQPHLVHEVVLYQRAHELEATRDDDYPVRCRSTVPSRYDRSACAASGLARTGRTSSSSTSRIL